VTVSDLAPSLAPSLVRLRSETNTLWPARSRDSDGWIGDKLHQARSSDHNPDEHGIVHAIDVTASGIQVTRFVVDVTQHGATHYVIWRGFLYSRYNGFVAVPYYGANPHNDHVHVSIRHNDKSRLSKRPWLWPNT